MILSLEIMSIIKIISINQYILTVFYMRSGIPQGHNVLKDTSADCYKYSIIDDYGTVYEPDDLFYSWEAAEQEGREAINTVSN